MLLMLRLDALLSRHFCVILLQTVYYRRSITDAQQRVLQKIDLYEHSLCKHQVCITYPCMGELPPARYSRPDPPTIPGFYAHV
jgi:hypothetical protein